jgi:hypothetical protein
MALGTVVWWNVQRLLGPDGSKLSRALGVTRAQGWGPPSYARKIDALAGVLRLVTPDGPPALLALAEVENGKVAKDLREAAGWPELALVEDVASGLAGDDLVLLYRPELLAPAGAPVSHNVSNSYATRDVLEQLFRTPTGHELVVLTVHWPSRILSNSPALRIGLGDYCARLVRAHLMFPRENLVTATGEARLPPPEEMTARWSRPLMVLGDFNDDPFDVSVSEALRGTRNPAAVAALPRASATTLERYLSCSPKLHNPCWPLLTCSGSPGGTLKWNGTWYLLDQLLLSHGLTAGDGIRYVDGSLRIVAPHTVTLPSGGSTTFCGADGAPRAFDPKTGKGISDHLPLAFELDLPSV